MIPKCVMIHNKNNKYQLAWYTQNLLAVLKTPYPVNMVIMLWP